MFGGRCPFGHRPSDPFKEKREAGPVARFAFQGEQVPMILGTDAAGIADPKEKAKIAHELGLDRPIIEQYGQWIGGMVRGDLGFAYVSERPTIEEIGPRIPISAKLAGMALFFAVLIGVGATAAKAEDTITSNIEQAKTELLALAEAGIDLVKITDELEADGLVQFPAIIGGVVPVINVEGVKPGEIKLDGPTLADIFQGVISDWGDKRIAIMNPGVKIPSGPITVVHRYTTVKAKTKQYK